MLFICKALLQKPPHSLCYLVTYKHGTDNVRSQDIVTLALLPVHTNLEKVISDTLLRTNGMQNTLHSLMSLEDLKRLLMNLQSYL